MADKPLSEDEALKAGSHYLRGSILESLADRVTGAVDPRDAKLLKFHGSYQQDDRDLRNERQRQKLEPAGVNKSDAGLEFHINFCNPNPNGARHDLP